MTIAAVVDAATLDRSGSSASAAGNAAGSNSSLLAIVESALPSLDSIGGF